VSKGQKLGIVLGKGDTTNVIITIVVQTYKPASLELTGSNRVSLDSKHVWLAGNGRVDVPMGLAKSHWRSFIEAKPCHGPPITNAFAPVPMIVQ
jgi:hypothetical protein